MIVGDNPVQVVAPIISRKTGAAVIRRRSDGRVRLTFTNRSVRFAIAVDSGCATSHVRQCRRTQSSRNPNFSTRHDYAITRLRVSSCSPGWCPEGEVEQAMTRKMIRGPSTLRETEGEILHCVISAHLPGNKGAPVFRRLRHLFS